MPLACQRPRTATTSAFQGLVWTCPFLSLHYILTFKVERHAYSTWGLLGWQQQDLSSCLFCRLRFKPVQSKESLSSVDGLYLWAQGIPHILI